MVHFGPVLKIGNGAPPVGDLLPRIDVVPQFTAAIAKAPMVMQQHHEAVIFGAGVAVGHGDRLKGVPDVPEQTATPKAQCRPRRESGRLLYGT